MLFLKSHWSVIQLNNVIKIFLILKTVNDKLAANLVAINLEKNNHCSVFIDFILLIFPDLKKNNLRLFLPALLLFIHANYSSQLTLNAYIWQMLLNKVISFWWSGEWFVILCIEPSYYFFLNVEDIFLSIFVSECFGFFFSSEFLHNL